MNHPDFDAYSKDLSELVAYEESDIAGFHFYGYDWIDNLHFLLPPHRVITDAHRCEALSAAVQKRFTDEGGWEGTGRLSLLWLPPFIFPFGGSVPTEGVIVWHVKQHEDGLSFLLSPIPLPFEQIAGS